MPIRIDQKTSDIVIVTLDNPARRNALTLDMFQDLAAFWERVSVDRTVRAVVLAGESGAFCSGADLSANLAQRPGIDDLIDRALLKTPFMPKPLIAAITGACVGGGLELALAADIRIAADDAVIGLPEVRWGIMPSGGGAMKLIDQIGQARAMEMLLTGRLIDAMEAERIGLVNAVYPAGQAYERALACAHAIARNSPVAVAAAKRSAMERRAVGYQTLEARERQLVAEVRQSGHADIGIAAFLARQQPIYGDA